MEWLNKLDSVLENVLPRNRNRTDSIDAEEYYRHNDEFPYNEEIGHDFDDEDADLMLEDSPSDLGSINLGNGGNGSSNDSIPDSDNQDLLRKAGVLDVLYRGFDIASTDAVIDLDTNEHATAHT